LVVGQLATADCCCASLKQLQLLLLLLQELLEGLWCCSREPRLDSLTAFLTDRCLDTSSCSTCHIPSLLLLLLLLCGATHWHVWW
jgi:hypothetical protein